MNGREAVKKDHEKAVADQLLAALKVEAAFERFGDPEKKEVDVIYKQGGRILGIEVATAYYEDRDAHDEWEIATGENPLAVGEIRLSSAGVIGNPDQRICERIQKELEDKCGKVYEGTDENWLCLNLNAPLGDAQSVAECVKNLHIPGEHRFGRIHITYTAPAHEGGKYTTVPLS